MEQHLQLRTYLKSNGFNVCTCCADSPRIGCYCDYCVLLRENIDIPHLINTDEIRKLEKVE